MEQRVSAVAPNVRMCPKRRRGWSERGRGGRGLNGALPRRKRQRQRQQPEDEPEPASQPGGRPAPSIEDQTDGRTAREVNAVYMLYDLQSSKYSFLAEVHVRLNKEESRERKLELSADVVVVELSDPITDRRSIRCDQVTDRTDGEG